MSVLSIPDRRRRRLPQTSLCLSPFQYSPPFLVWAIKKLKIFDQMYHANTCYNHLCNHRGGCQCPNFVLSLFPPLVCLQVSELCDSPKSDFQGEKKQSGEAEVLGSSPWKTSSPDNLCPLLYCSSPHKSSCPCFRFLPQSFWPPSSFAVASRMRWWKLKETLKISCW